MTKGIVAWFGEGIYLKVAVAEREAVVETLDAAVVQARSDHGWQSRTGAAERSIQRVEVSDARQRKGALGAFGFTPIETIGPVRPRRSQKTGRLRKPQKWDIHGMFLEIGFRGKAGDGTIRRAGGVEFPKLAERIARRIRA